ncbi:plasmid mobilization protein, partial [Staphylococcus arlettae]
MNRTNQKAITFKLTNEEYKKIQDLSAYCHMSPTEYARHQALGNQIKPTILHQETNVDKGVNFISEDKYEKQVSYSKKLKRAYNQATNELESERLKINTMNRLLPYVQSDGSIDTNEYQKDRT